MRRHGLTQRPEGFRLDSGHPLANGLVFAGLGRFQGSTRYDDASGYGRHGTLTGMAPATDWVWVPQLGRWGLNFDGGTKYVTTAAKPPIEPYTLSAWMKQPSGVGNINARATGIALNYTAWGRSDGIGTSRPWVSSYWEWRYGLGKNDANPTLYITFHSNPERWIHVVGVFHATSAQDLYIDGIYYGSSTVTSANPTVSIELGRQDDGFYFLSFLLDPLIYNRVLSPAEIQQLADPSNVMLSGLILPPRRRLWAVPAAATNRRRRVICGAS